MFQYKRNHTVQCFVNLYTSYSIRTIHTNDIQVK